MEQQRRNALINNEIDKLEPLLNAEFLYIHAIGVTTEKTDYVNFCRSGAAKYLASKPIASRPACAARTRS